jgi:hypothetical protein
MISYNPSLSQNRPSPAALIAAALRDALCAIAGAATIIVLCTVFEPGPQVSSVARNVKPCLTPAHADPIGALIRQASLGEGR